VRVALLNIFQRSPAQASARYLAETRSDATPSGVAFAGAKLPQLVRR
jgi:hypothetical protein